MQYCADANCVKPKKAAKKVDNCKSLVFMISVFEFGLQNTRLVSIKSCLVEELIMLVEDKSHFVYIFCSLMGNNKVLIYQKEYFIFHSDNSKKRATHLGRPFYDLELFTYCLMSVLKEAFPSTLILTR